MYPGSTHTKKQNLVLAVCKHMKNMAFFPIWGGIHAALSLVAGACLPSPPYDTPCSVPINGPKFHVDHPHVAGGVCEQRILALRNYVYT